MLQRVITGAAIAIVIIAMLFSNAAVVGIFVSLLILIAQFEMSKVVGLKHKKALTLCNVFFSVVYSCAVFFDVINYIGIISTFYIIVLFVIMLFNYEKVDFSDISVSIFCMIYITASMLYIVAVRNMQFGNIYIYLVFLGAFATDTCAYFVGVLFGKNKLCVKISPKKTIEGAIGGEVGTVLVMLIFGYAVNKIVGTSVNYPLLALLGVLSGLVSQLGDLTASIIKRKFEVKDYGAILPGHGGVMDRIDSIILMAPLVYYFVSYLPLIGA